jgi:general stress protein 26
VRIEQILIDYEDVQSRTSSESLGSGNVSVSTTIKPMSLGEELMAKRKSTTTTKKKTTTTTKITDRYKMNILGKVYIK